MTWTLTPKATLARTHGNSWVEAQCTLEKELGGVPYRFGEDMVLEAEPLAHPEQEAPVGDDIAAMQPVEWQLMLRRHPSERIHHYEVTTGELLRQRD